MLAKDHTRAVMLGFDEDNRLLIELHFDTEGSLDKIDFELLNLQGLTERKLDEIAVMAKELKRKRIQRAVQEFGKIGRNELCPCGSGKKNKKCCRINC